MAKNKNVVYFTIQGGYISSIPINDNNQLFTAEVTQLQKDRLETLLANQAESASSGSYNLDTFEALTDHMKHIKTKRFP